MRRITQLLLLLLPVGVLSQNLVPNPSFEDATTCPNTLDQVFLLNGWTTFRNSPDYFSTCTSSLVGVPANQFGYQFANTGNSYCGFKSFFTSQYREILGEQLGANLVVGQKYFISVHFNLAIGGAAPGNCATNKLGVLFTTSQYSLSQPIAINNFAHIYTDSIFKDSLNWVSLKSSFIADSAYSFIAIGNFFDDAHTDTLMYGNYCQSYYYVDDVCVSTDSLYCENWTGIPQNINTTKIQFYPNPAENYVIINYKNIDKLILCNVLGQIVFEKELLLPNDAIKVDVSALTKGMDIFKIISKGMFNSKQILIQ